MSPWGPCRPGLQEMLSQYLCKERRTEVLSLLVLAVTADLPSEKTTVAAHFHLGVPAAIWWEGGGTGRETVPSKST